MVEVETHSAYCRKTGYEKPNMNNNIITILYIIPMITAKPAAETDPRIPSLDHLGQLCEEYERIHRNVFFTNSDGGADLRSRGKFGFETFE